jgi:hypothetical protein
MYRCSDCEGLQMYCQCCAVVLHCAMTLHHMEVFIHKSIHLSKFWSLITCRSGQVKTFSALPFAILGYTCSSSIPIGSHVVTQLQHLIINSQFSTLMVFMVLCSMSVTANLHRLIPFNYCVLNDTLLQVPTLERLLSSGSSIIFKSTHLNPRDLCLNIIKLCLAWLITQTQRNPR